MAYNGLSQDRLVRKEVALGAIRGFEPPQDHIGTRLIAPLEGVESDDVIFAYTRGLTAGLTPARAEDAESEMAGKDDSIGSGRASIIDWAHKDHYDVSDVTRYRESLILGGLAGAESLELVTRSIREGFDNKIARDTARRRRMLDNRLEWLIMTALDRGVLTYNDGKIVFSVDFQRPAAQQDMAPPKSATYWGATGDDPIEDILSIKSLGRAQGINLKRAIMSDRVWRQLRRSTKFTDALTGANPLYKVSGWGDKAATDFVQDQTEMEFIVYDSVYRTRPLGSNTITDTRYTRDNVVIFLPDQASIDQMDDSIGFAKTLTSPHVEGNWSSGFYEWEKDRGPDPWGYDMGTGIKAFPVFPHLYMTYVMTVLAP